MHGLGNDFVIIDSSENQPAIKKKETLKKIGSRNFGVGCDQILIIESNDYENAEVTIFVVNFGGQTTVLKTAEFECSSRHISTMLCSITSNPVVSKSR